MSLDGFTLNSGEMGRIENEVCSTPRYHDVHVWGVSRLMKCFLLGARLVRMIMIYAPGWLSMPRLGVKRYGRKAWGMYRID